MSCWISASHLDDQFRKVIQKCEDLDRQVKALIERDKYPLVVHEAERPRLPDEKRVEANEWSRASGLATCTHCGIAFNLHDTVRGYRWLTRLCDGRLVKL